MKTEFKKIFDRIDKSNKAFDKMTADQRRVRVAQDALDLLKVGFLKPGWGYVEASRRVNLELDLKEQVQSFPTCDVCAKGALFVSCLLRKNEITAQDAGVYDTNGVFLSEEATSSYVVNQTKLFSQRQFNLIEDHFEEGLENGGCFYETGLDRHEKLTLVLKNIILNKGQFRPSTPLVFQRGAWKWKPNIS